MIYTNLLLFLVAVFLFTMDAVPEVPMLPGWSALMIFVFTVVGFDRLCVYQFSRSSTLTSAGYFSAEKRLSIASLLVFGFGALYLCDAKYYLSILSLGGHLPALVNVGGLTLFLAYLSIMWRVARRNYQHVFGRSYQPLGFIINNVKANLPIVLPWVVLSLCYDLLALIPYHPIQAVLASQWGDLVFFVMFLLFVVLFFPPLVRWLWGCRPLPEGDLKDKLQRFCKSQNFKAELFLWPLFEGKVLTAGVMGLLPGLRYVLLTPAIIQTMTMEELESVMAHEIGHIKRYHLLLYLMLICGFSVFAGLLAAPFIYFVLSQNVVIDQMVNFGVSPDTVETTMYGVVILTALVIYFRFIFGYFIRNFERQADLHVISAVGTGRALISAFEKISYMSGNIRDEKNWHHFGIGERIDCLVEAEREPEKSRKHDIKVRNSLIGYVAVLVIAIVLLGQYPTGQHHQEYTENYTSAYLIKKAADEPENPAWHQLLATFMLSKKMEAEALAAYEKAYSLEPANPKLMNNIAWLLVTSEDLTLRDPLKALTLARTAATLMPQGYILDTLATAYWANGFIEEAVDAEKQAAFADPGQRNFYMSQAERFMRESYEESVSRKESEQQNVIEG